jgi:hypothetical protein
MIRNIHVVIIGAGTDLRSVFLLFFNMAAGTTGLLAAQGLKKVPQCEQARETRCV